MAFAPQAKFDQKAFKSLILALFSYHIILREIVNFGC